MENIIQIIRDLPNLLPLKAATDNEIADAELQLRLNFAKEYKEYLSTFGAILADGIELTGITKSLHRNVVAVTKQEWELNSNIPHTMYVIENTGIDSIIIWQDSTGAIFQASPNNPPKRIAASLAKYIARN